MVRIANRKGFARVVEAVNSEPDPQGPGNILGKLKLVEDTIIGRLKEIEGATVEAQNSGKSNAEELGKLAKQLADVQAAIAGVREAVNSAPGPEAKRAAILKALALLYQGRPLAEIQNAAPADFLRVDTIREIIGWDGGTGFNLEALAYIQPSRAATAKIGVAARTGARRQKAEARDWDAGSVSVDLKAMRDYVAVDLADRLASDFNIIGDIAAGYLDNEQIRLAEEFVLGQVGGREDAAYECKGVLAYDTTSPDEDGLYEDGKLRVVTAGVDGAVDDEALEAALTEAWNRLPKPLRSRAALVCNSTLATRLRNIRYLTGVSKVDANDRWDGKCVLEENSNMPDVESEAIVGIMMVSKRAYGLALNPDINAGVDKDQGDEAYWTMRTCGGAIADFTCIYGIQVAALT